MAFTPDPQCNRLLKLILACALAVFAVPATAQTCNYTSTLCKWAAGDIFLSGAGANGKWFVFRPGAGIIDSISDGVSGAGQNRASAIDNTWHLVGSDATNATIVKFRVAPNDTTNPSPVTQVVSSFSANSIASDPQAMVIDAAGNIWVALANTPKIAKLSPTGTLLTSFTLNTRDVDVQLAGIDIKPDQTLAYYTSGGNKLRTLQLTGTGAGTVSTLTTISGLNLYDVRLIPHAWLPTGATACAGIPCPSGDALLVAGKAGVALVDIAQKKAIDTYKISGQTDLQVLTLDPMLYSKAAPNGASSLVPLQGFLVGSASSPNFYHVPLSGGSPTSYSAAGTGLTGLYSLATYPGFSALQSAPTQFTGAAPLTAGANSSQTSSDNFIFQTDKLSLTAYANPNFGASGYTTTPTVYANAVQQSGGNADAGYPCTQTLSGGLCTIWQVDLSNPLPLNAVMALKVDSTPGIQNADTHFFRDQWNDVSDKIDASGWGKISVYSLNQIAPVVSPGTANCIYSPPVNTDYPNSNLGGELNNPGNVTFRFTCFGISNSVIGSLFPRISVVQLNTGDAPLPYFPVFTSLTGGTCCTQADYRLDTSANPYTWVINVSFKNLPTSPETFVATTYDESHQISAFDITFTVLNGNQNLK